MCISWACWIGAKALPRPINCDAPFGNVRLNDFAVSRHMFSRELRWSFVSQRKMRQHFANKASQTSKPFHLRERLRRIELRHVENQRSVVSLFLLEGWICRSTARHSSFSSIKFGQRFRKG